jgi:type IV secretory pathway TrbF-like protein
MELKAMGRAISQVSPKERTAPEQKSLASVITKILQVVSEWSIVVKQSWLTTIALIASKAN